MNAVDRFFISMNFIILLVYNMVCFMQIANAIQKHSCKCAKEPVKVVAEDIK